MPGTAGRCSIQRCSAGVCHAEVRALFVQVTPAWAVQSKRAQLFFKRNNSWQVNISRSKPRELQQKWRCMVSQRQDSQPGTNNILKFLNIVNDSTKYVVTVTAGGVLAWYHNVYVSWCIVGSIVAVFVCKALKNIINLQRPLHARKQDPGMPSSHASSLAYLAVYLAIAWHPKQPALASTGLVVAALLIPLRVILGYHSIPQVAVGTVLGGVSAYCWYTLGQLAILPILEADSSSRQILAATTAAALGCYMVAAFRSN